MLSALQSGHWDDEQIYQLDWINRFYKPGRGTSALGSVCQAALLCPQGHLESSWPPGTCLPRLWATLLGICDHFQPEQSWACSQGSRKLSSWGGLPCSGRPTRRLDRDKHGLMVAVCEGRDLTWSLDVRIGVSTCIHVPSQCRTEPQGEGRAGCHVLTQDSKWPRDYTVESNLPGHC